jgi:hypothetical protein
MQKQRPAKNSIQQQEQESDGHKIRGLGNVKVKRRYKTVRDFGKGNVLPFFGIVSNKNKTVGSEESEPEEEVCNQRLQQQEWRVLPHVHPDPVCQICECGHMRATNI